MKKMSEFVKLLDLIFVFALFTLVAHAQDSKEAQNLQPNQTIERKMTGAETHRYKFDLKARVFFQVRVEQKGVDVALKLLDASGNTLATMDSPNGKEGFETLSYIADKAGGFVLEIIGFDKEAEKGIYQIKREPSRTANAADQRRVEVERIFVEGITARDAEGGRETAIAKLETALVGWQKLKDAYLAQLTVVQLQQLEEYANETDVRPLKFGEAIERLIKGGEAHNYPVELKQGQLLQIQLQEKGIDVRIVLIRFVDEQSIAQASFGSGYDREVLTSVIKQAGQYAVVIFSPGSKLSGNYQFTATTKEVAASGDLEQIKAEKLLAEGSASRNQETAEGLRGAIAKLEESLILWRKIGDKYWEGYTTNFLGSIHNDLGEKKKALNYYNQSLPLSRAVGDKSGEAVTLNNIGAVYSTLGEQQKALDNYNQSLPLSRVVGDKSQEAVTLNNIGNVYLDLGEKQKALDYYNQSLPLRRAVRDRDGEATTLTGIGLVYNDLGKKQKALNYLNQSLPLRRAIGDKSGEATTLNNIGAVYNDLGEKKKALDYYNQSLPLSRAVGDKSGEATTLNNIGGVHFDLGEKQKALDYYNQSLPLSRAVGGKSQEAVTLNNVMYVWESLKNGQLAVFYGKQSVNKYQELRQAIQGLDKDTQKTFLGTVEYTYRLLADILINQGRIAEAEQVLGMLKEEEYLSYLRRDDKVAADLKGRISLSPDEKIAFADYEKFADDITRAAQEFGALEKKKNDLPLGASLSADEQKQYDALKAKYDAAVVVFDKFLNDLKVKFGANDKRVAGVAESDTQGILKRMNEPRTVIISTIVGEDRLNLIVTTADTQRAHTVNIKAADLNKLVADFRDAVKNPQVDPRPLGKKLYDVLFPAALQKDLDNIKADTLVWSLDGTLRYVPMAALWDGKGYLVERYTNAVLTLASRDKITAQTSDRTKWQALGVGVSKRYQDFPALAAVPQELCSVIRDPQKKAFCAALGTRENGVIGGLMLADDEFTLAGFENNLGKVPVIHIASHFALNAGDESDSYLLLGGGEQRRFSLVSLKKTRLDKVELLTLSACNTAMTSGSNSSGVEIEGFGALAQQQGARTVLASLWSVADDSTRDLMTAFYGKLKTDTTLGKAAALRQAQIELLNGTYKADEAAKKRGTEIINLNGTANTQPAFKVDANAPFAHPYYWSPFILFGNWR